MENAIKHYYNIDTKVTDYKTYFTFFYNNYNYYFVELIKDEKSLEEVMNYINIKESLFHKPIYNVNNTYITEYNNKKYILLKLEESEIKEYNIDDIISFSNKYKINIKDYSNNWSKYWSEKIDYMEYQISELGKDKSIIIDSFSYYVGLGENAISYANIIMKTYPLPENELCISHRRIYIPNYHINFYNPLLINVDLIVRDVAEYIKSLFFYNKEYAINNLKYYLSKIKLSPYSIGMLYSRLLFPTYYFDLYEKVILNELEEQELIKIIKDNKEYELFLRESYTELIKYANIPKIEWIIKKEL